MRSVGPEVTGNPSTVADSVDARTAPSRSRLAVKAAGFVVLLIVLWFAGRVALLAFAGMLLGVFLGAVGGKIGQWTGWNYRLCVVLVTILLLGLIGALAWLFQAQVLSEVEQFVKSVLGSIGQLKHRLAGYDWGRSLLQALDGGGPMANPEALVSGLYGAAYGWLTVMVDAVTIFFVGFFGALEPGLYRRGLLHLVPPRHRGRSGEVLDECVQTLQRWLAAKFCSMAIVGVATGTGLAVIGIQPWLLLAVIAALMEFVPNFGPLLAAVPALLLAIPEGGTAVLWVAVLYAAVQTIESNLILPLLQERMARLPPVLTILAIILMGLLAGALGVLVATPLLAVLIVCTKRFYVEDALHSSLDSEPG